MAGIFFFKAKYLKRLMQAVNRKHVFSVFFFDGFSLKLQAVVYKRVIRTRLYSSILTMVHHEHATEELL